MSKEEFERKLWDVIIEGRKLGYLKDFHEWCVVKAVPPANTNQPYFEPCGGKHNDSDCLIVASCGNPTRFPVGRDERITLYLSSYLASRDA